MMSIKFIDGETTSTAPEGGTTEVVAEAVAEVAEAVAEAVAEPTEAAPIVDVDLIAEAVANQLTEAAELEKEQTEFKQWQDNLTFELEMIRNEISGIYSFVSDIREKITIPVPVEELENNPVAAVEVIPEPVVKTEESEPVAAKSRKWF